MSLNASQAENGPPMLLPSIVAFIDILGFAEEIKASHAAGESNALLRRVMEVVHKWYSMMKGLPQLAERGRRTWELKAFTDNVVIGHPIKWGGEPEFGRLISDVALLQIGFAHEGFFVRGGLAVGDLYMDEDIVFGMGLLDAYEAEQSAIWPRVTLADSAVQLVRQHLSYYASVEISPQNRDLLIDADNQLFVNYLSCTWPDHTLPPFLDWLSNHRDAVAGKLKKYRADHKISGKYSWAARYHNYFCESIPGGKAYTIDISPFKLQPKRLQEAVF